MQNVTVTFPLWLVALLFGWFEEVKKNQKHPDFGGISHLSINQVESRKWYNFFVGKKFRPTIFVRRLY